MFRIKDIRISNIGPVKDLELKFDDHFNIICGQNGIGKTTILDCLAQSFSRNRTSLKKTSGSETGNWVIGISGSDDRYVHHSTFKVTNLGPSEQGTDSMDLHGNSTEIIVFKTHRDISYSQVSELKNDPPKDHRNFCDELFLGSLSDDLKQWFAFRYLRSKHKNSLDEFQMKNIKMAIECFSLLNCDIRFNRIDFDTNDILLTTPKGEIYLEYLSSGYKSCLAVLIGLIKEIEYRYKKPSKYIKDFEGIVFIDEIDLHLHPEWQAKIYVALKALLPKAQIFTTTHSPHIIQVAKSSEIIPLVLNENNEVVLNPVGNETYGFQGWTVEEILTNVMGMSETRTKTYLDIIADFNTAIENENYKEAKKLFNKIDKMLHPDNILRKIFKIQLTGLE